MFIHAPDHLREIVADFTEYERDLIIEYEKMVYDLEENNIFKGFWSVKQKGNRKPSSREGSAMIQHKNKVYMFGGYAHDRVADMKVLDVETWEWTEIKMNKFTMPAPRFYHSLSKYKEYLVMFGGGGNYIAKIKKRESFNSLFLFDLNNEKWINTEELSLASLATSEIVEPPAKRFNHAADVLGCFLLVHGGINGEEKEILSDFALYDLERHMWMQVHEHRLTPKRSVGYRFMHTMTSFLLPLIEEHKWSRSLWMQKVKHVKTILNAGFFMFGGKFKNKEVTNELWYITPNTVKNKNLVTGKLSKIIV